jgi:hypothetical protein
MSTPGNVDDYLTSLTTSAPSAPTTLEGLLSAGTATPPVVPAPALKRTMDQFIESGQDLTMDPDGLQEVIANCEKHIRALSDLQQRARDELYVESLGIGENGFEPAKQLLTKYQHKARGGGSIPEQSSAVGYIASLITWVTDFRDALQSARNAYLATDAATDGKLGSIAIAIDQ